MPKELTVSATDEVLDDDPLIDAAPGGGDIDPGAWLARDDSRRYGRVQVSGGTLKVGALTNREYDVLRASVRKINPKNPADPDGIVDGKKLSRVVVAFAINKAHGWARIEGGQVINDSQAVRADALDAKLTGDVLELMRGVLSLSGLVSDDKRVDPVPFEG